MAQIIPPTDKMIFLSATIVPVVRRRVKNCVTIDAAIDTFVAGMKLRLKKSQSGKFGRSLRAQCGRGLGDTISAVIHATPPHAPAVHY